MTDHTASPEVLALAVENAGERIALMEVHIAGLEAENAALKRHNLELRAAVAALLEPDKVK
jgi:uncharacterized small protein (DUF1192 family)